jgi:hypothetical protein
MLLSRGRINMETVVNLDKIYKPSDEVVAREVQGEFIIIPITSGIGDLEDEIFTLNESGRAIWEKLDGRITLRQAAGKLAEEFQGPAPEIEKDILGITEELLKRRMLVEVSAK